MEHRYTIAEIAAANAAAGYYFFSRDTLRFHKDKRSNWSVRHIGGKVYIRHKITGQVRRFYPDNGGPDQGYRAGGISVALPSHSEPLPEGLTNG